MQALRLIRGKEEMKTQAGECEAAFSMDEEKYRERSLAYISTAGIASVERWDDPSPHCRPGEFFKNLSSKALSDFDSLAKSHCYPSMAILIREAEEPSNVLISLDGKVKLSINSVGGRRLIVGIAGPGEILGLNSIISGFPYEITAEAQFPCMISSLERQSFLDFMLRYPVASKNMTRQLGMDYKRTTQQLRTLGLTLTAQAKLARLLMDWCPVSVHTGSGDRIHFPLTHGEIGEHIGVSRETVSRSLNELKNMGLVTQHGSIMTIPNRQALAIFASAD
jgi:CRP/FNR family transcriptional regulator, cyclic AMP receptor protein